MMTSRQRVIQALVHEPLDRPPRYVRVAPGAEGLLRDELDEMLVRYPRDIVPPDSPRPRGRRVRGRPYEPGSYTDAWGCTWRVRQRGQRPERTGCPLADPAAAAHYQPPWELVEGIQPGRVNRHCAATSQFVLAETQVRPLERLRWLRGDAAVLDGLTHGDRPTRGLLEQFRQLARREFDLWASTEVDGVAFGDDWLVPTDPLASQHLWRDLLRPWFQELCDQLQERDKFAFFRASGRIGPFFGELAAAGFDAVHCHWSPEDVPSMVGPVQKQAALWSGVADPDVLRRGNPEEIRAAVRQLRQDFDRGSGGVIPQCTWEPGVAFRSVAVLLECWQEPTPAPSRPARVG